MKTQLMYIANDGTPHASPDECLTYEKKLAESTIDEGIEYFVEKRFYRYFASQRSREDIITVLQEYKYELCAILDGSLELEDNWLEKLEDEREVGDE